MMNKPAACIALSALVLLAGCGRKDTKEVGEFKNDLYGNEIKVEALSDPKVTGVTCHLTYFDRGVWDRAIKGNWFEDPSNSSIACRQTGPIVIGDIDRDKNGETVFTQRQSLVFKSIAVRRVYDPDNETLMYIVYSRKPVDGSAKMSLSTVALYGGDARWADGTVVTLSGDAAP
ncbi:CreA family protein [Parvularcula sp. LCG005]|uniref:CreA family protein n=1 Tax=Parvularcula sp. LCG005 TaxID=3078805 RepID=UPI002942FE31|nr:CreA family protein [Parvularcula sp. LCG005]WOI53137.1 CreA family protein [Parvularcula sp. LCG005]